MTCREIFLSATRSVSRDQQYKLTGTAVIEKTRTVGRGKNAQKVVEKTKLGEVWGTPNGQRLKVTKTLANGSKQDEEADGFFLSGDKNFRPTDAIFGEDGALYVADWQSVIIGHMQHNVRDPNQGSQARTHLPRQLYPEASPEESRDRRTMGEIA